MVIPESQLNTWSNQGTTTSARSTDQKQRRLILAMKRIIVERFGSPEWEELAFLTNGKDIIENHPRLLRSLYWRDPDYDNNVLEVIESLIQKEPENLEEISTHLDLLAWLKEHDPKEYAKLYGHTQLLLNNLGERGITNSFDLNQHILRIQDGIDSDPELAIGSTKELLESIMKCILEAHGESVGKEDLPTLLKRTRKILKLDPSEFDETRKGGKIVKRTLSSLGQIVTGIDELRNSYGTGHGRTRRSGVTPRHARLVVNAGAALAVFLIETFEHHKKDS